MSTKFGDVFSNQYVIALSFCVLSRKQSTCTRIAIHEKRLKIAHSTYWVIIERKPQYESGKDIGIPLLIDLLISNNFSMTFFCSTRILRISYELCYTNSILFYYVQASSSWLLGADSLKRYFNGNFYFTKSWRLYRVYKSCLDNKSMIFYCKLISICGK